MVDPGGSRQREIVDVPTNVITGFLGVGKSTAILHLLEQRPPDERWAVLVNEFGEVGIDGNLLEGHEGGRDGIFVREVAGGCMCCTSGLPMQIVLTSLLAQARPDRLLIEPTGLGHPREVLQTLTADHYRKVLDLRATITLVDARKVRDPRYAQHPTFLQQLAVADLIVANKVDRYDAGDLPALQAFLDAAEGLAEKPLFEVEHGALQLPWLETPAAGWAVERDGHDHGHGHGHGHASDESRMPVAPEIPKAGFLRIDNEGDGYFSQGWMFDPSWTFDGNRLHELLMGIDATRLKGVFLTDQGVAAYNLADQVLTKSQLVDGPDSRVEVISAERDCFEGLEQALLGCVLSR